MEVAELQVRVDGQKAKREAKEVKREVKQIGPEAERTSRRSVTAFQRMGGAASRVRRLVLGIGAAAAVIAGARTFAGFEQSMANVEAVTMSTEREMAELESTARQLGATTAFSAIEAAEGMQFLGQAGLETNDIISTMPGLLSLAAAGSLDLATAADKATNIMGQFSLGVEETNRVVNALAATAAKSNTNVLQMAQALTLAGLPASNLGVQIEEVGALIGKLGDQGLQATRGGTGLRQFFVRLASPTQEAVRELAKVGLTMEDVDVKARGLFPVLNDLAQAEIGLGEAAAIFGSETSTAALAILNVVKASGDGSKTIEQLHGEIVAATTAAQDMARIKLDTLIGDIKLLKSAMSELALVVFADGGIGEGLRKMVQGMTSLTQVATTVTKSISIAWDAMALDVLETTKDMQAANFNFWNRISTDADVFVRKIPGHVSLAFNKVIRLGANMTSTVLKQFSELGAGAARSMSALDRFNPDFVDGVREASLALRIMANDMDEAADQAVLGSRQILAASEKAGRDAGHDRFLENEKFLAEEIADIRGRMTVKLVQTAAGQASELIDLSGATADAIKDDNQEVADSAAEALDKVARTRDQIIEALEAGTMSAGESIRAGLELTLDDWGNASQQMADLAGGIANSIGDNISPRVVRPGNRCRDGPGGVRANGARHHSGHHSDDDSSVGVPIDRKRSRVRWLWRCRCRRGCGGRCRACWPFGRPCG